MHDDPFLAGMWHKAEMLQRAESEMREANRRSREATKQLWRKTLLYAAAALALLGICLLVFLLTGRGFSAALVPAVYLPFSVALLWDGRLFSAQATAMTDKGVSTQ